MAENVRISDTNQTNVEEIIQASYLELGLRVPEILILPSPYAAVEKIVSIQLKSPLSKTFKANYKRLVQQVSIQLNLNVRQELSNLAQRYQEDRWFDALDVANRELLYPLFKPLSKEERSRAKNCIKPESLIQYQVFMDFSLSVLGCTCNLGRWQIFRSLIQECDWIYPFRETCLVCDRPLQCNYRPGFKKLTISFRDGHKFKAFADERNASQDDWNMWMGRAMRLDWI